ncbi:MAG: thiamine pyrophosphate-dependent enzyme [candidate division KSB1 bacterium]|nr:thiamine pyrophosphate-dependent enzyme [candidate division KSB1 bacterium]
MQAYARETETFSLSPETARRWYQLMHTSRLIDDKAWLLFKQAKGWSYLATCGGHEGIQLALGLSFRPNKDFLFPYYRDQLTCLAAGLTLEEIFLNGLSRRDDVAAGGRHMSNHFAKPTIGIQNVSSCVANHALHAVGVARAIKYYQSDAIAFASFGEASTSEGYVYEAFNGASRERLPVIFVIQNNRYGISVPLHEQTANECVADNYVGLKYIHIVRCDGTDPIDCRNAMDEALDYVRSGSGPAIVHADCVRIGPHSNSDRHESYRSGEELEAVRAQDPLARFRKYMLTEGLISEEELVAIEAANKQAVDAAAQRAEAAPLPDPKSVYNFVIPEPFAPEETPAPAEGKKEKFREAINRTLHEEFQRNPNTFLWGQDVATGDKGGVFNVTEGMQKAFGRSRVFNAPLAEDFIVGTANGFCRFSKDIWVVIEAAQFADYVWPAMEQMVETTHEYWRTNGQFAPNIVARLACGGFIGGGLYHSQSVEGVFADFPGCRIVMPAFADDACGLLRTAMRSRGLTLYLEPKYLYNLPSAQAPQTGPEHFVPFGKARIRRPGNDLTIVAYGNAVHFALKAADRLASEAGIETEVIDLRTLVPMDMETVRGSIAKTNRALVASEDHKTGGFGGEMLSRIVEECFELLDAPPQRVCSLDTPIGFSRILEAETLIDDRKIYDAVLQMMQY